MTLLCFSLADARYGVPIDRVIEVTARLLLTPLPDAPPAITGVFSYRGAPLPAIDLRARLGHPARPPERDDHFVIVHTARRPAALVVDRALGMQDAPAAALSPPPFPSRSVAGIAPLPDGLLLIYDLDAALSLDEERAVDAGLHHLAAQP